MARSAERPQFQFPPILGVIVAVAVLYFARDFLIPFTLAILFAFLLSPLVRRLEGWHAPRAVAVVLVMSLALGAAVGVGWTVTAQLMDIVSQLPRYRDNIHRKLAALHGSQGGLRSALQNLEELGGEIVTRQTAEIARPVQVEIVNANRSGVEAISAMLGPIINPLATLGIVVVFTLFMLLVREDLRNRLLSLAGQQRLYLTTQAMDEAGQRIVRYISVQSLVNLGLGIVIGFGLYLAGVSGFLLWGALAALLRFVPYAGIALAGAMPFLLVLATTDGWRSPLLVLAIFLVAEAITGNIVEPLVYGAHTGLSTFAVIVSAVFWTVIWGPVGLILATPLTVCLSVVGRNFRPLQFLDVLLGDAPALPPSAALYQRLLALDQHEALELLESETKTRGVIETFDLVLIPAIVMAQQDRQTGALEEKRESFIIQNINEFVTEITESDRLEQAGLQPAAPQQQGRVFCIPANDMADEIAAAMFAYAAQREGFPALAFPVTESPSSLLEGLQPQAGDTVCVSATPPLALSNARRVSREIRDRFPEISIIVGLWNYSPSGSKTWERLAKSFPGALAGSLIEAMDTLRAHSRTPAAEPDESGIPLA